MKKKKKGQLTLSKVLHCRPAESRACIRAQGKAFEPPESYCLLGHERLLVLGESVLLILIISECEAVAILSIALLYSAY